MLEHPIEPMDSAPGEMDMMKAKSLNPSRGRQAADFFTYRFLRAARGEEEKTGFKHVMDNSR